LNPKDGPLTGQEALDFFEELKRKHAKQMAEDLAREKADAQRRGKEPFDLEKLARLVDVTTTDEGSPIPPEERQAMFEYEYYVNKPSKMTLAEYAEFLRRSRLG
jgi:hypothetical protein